MGCRVQDAKKHPVRQPFDNGSWKAACPVASALAWELENPSSVPGSGCWVTLTESFHSVCLFCAPMLCPFRSKLIGAGACVCSTMGP